MTGQTGYIYLIKAGDHYKIGKSINVARRLREFNFPIPAELLHTIAVPSMTRAESHLHKRFADQRVRGEWFALSPDDVAWICSLETLDPQPEPAPPVVTQRRTPMPEEKYYTVQQVAEKFGVHRTTVYDWMQSGLEYVQVGGRRRITESALQGFIKRGGAVGSVKAKSETGESVEESSGNSLPALLEAA